MPVRALLGPSIIGISVWCAAGELTLAAASSTVRLAVPAPWWVFVAALAAGLASPSWRRAPWLAAPALGSVLPWLPVPMPAVGLVWTGPMAWTPVAAAVAIGPGREVAAAAARALTALAPRPAAIVAGLLSLVVGVAAAWSVAPRLPGGDEPHYLVITQSLLADADLRIENNHANRDYADYFGGTINPDFLVRGQDGEIYSIHAPGVAALVAPAFAAFGYRGAQATVLLLAALTAALIWRAAFDLSGDRGAAWFAWAAVTLTATFVLQSVTIFPDGPGALGVALACWLLVRLEDESSRPGGLALVGTGVALAALPWLHTRFAVLAAGLGLAIGWRLWTGGAGGGRRLAAFLAVPGVSALAWFGFFQVTYGTPNPAAPYGPNPESSLAFVPGGLLGLLFDQQFGLLVAGPVLAGVAFGLAGGRGAFARRAAGAVAIAYLAAVCTYWMWWAGRPASPARFAAAALPALGLPLAWAWHRATPGARAAWLALLTVTACITTCLVAVGRGALGWNDRTANALLFEWLGPVVDLPRGLPSFFLALDPARLATIGTFATHVAIFVALAALSVAAALALGRRTASTARRRLVLASFGLAAVMVVLQAGWWFTGASPADPVRSQAALVAASQPGARVWRIQPARASRVTLAESGLRLVPEAPGRTAPANGPVVFVNLPPVRGVLHVAADPPVTSRVTLGVGRDGERFRPLAIEDGVASLPLALPAGATELSVGPDPGASLHVWLEPQARLPEVGGRALATVQGRLNGREIHLLDRNVFVEEDAFWVRGGTIATLVWQMPPDAGDVLRLTLRNGAMDNDVGLRIGGTWQRHRLAPSASMDLEVPVADGVAVLSVESPEGFRPADVDGGADRRYLGVWIGPR